MSRNFKDIGKDFEGKAKKLDRAMRNDIPRVIGEEHKNGFRRSFRQQKFYDYGGRSWPNPDRTDNSTPFPPPTRSHLTRDTLIGKAGAGGSGLQDSFKVRIDPKYIRILNTKPYAGIHNEGGSVTVTVTEKMRKFAWAMYYKAKKRGARNYESWKGLALTNKRQITVKIPQRKFMGHSRRLDDDVDSEIDKELDQIFYK